MLEDSTYQPMCEVDLKWVSVITPLLLPKSSAMACFELMIVLYVLAARCLFSYLIIAEPRFSAKHHITQLYKSTFDLTAHKKGESKDSSLLCPVHVLCYLDWTTAIRSTEQLLVMW